MWRIRLTRTRHLLITGFVVGLVIASAVTIASVRRYDAPAVYLLGSGAGVSALIASEKNRVLVASGNDPAALANAFAAARPAMLTRIDLVVLMPAANERVAERAVEIARPTRVYALPNNRFHPGDMIAGHRIRPLDGSGSVQLSQHLRMDLFDDPLAGWSIRIEYRSTAVMLSERIPLRPQSSMLVVTGDSVADDILAVDQPVFSAADAAPHGWVAWDPQRLTLIERGEVVRIRLTETGLAIQT